MRTRMRIPREKHKRFIPINSQTKATVYVSSILKLKPLNAYLDLTIFRLIFLVPLPLLYSTKWSKNPL